MSLSRFLPSLKHVKLLKIMVVDKVNGSPKRTTSPVRSSTRIRAARFQPTAREALVVTKPSPQRNLSQTSSTIYKLSIPGQTHVQHTVLGKKILPEF